MWQLLNILLVLIYNVQGKHFNYDSFSGDGAMEEFPHELDTESDMMNARESHGDYISNADHNNHNDLHIEEETKSGFQRLTVKPNRCYYYPNKGSCNRYQRRFYYDHVFKTCKPFLYTGCGGNSNRFFTRAACMKTCAT